SGQRWPSGKSPVRGERVPGSKHDTTECLPTMRDCCTPNHKDKRAPFAYACQVPTILICTSEQDDCGNEESERELD
ncbi:hypothetical protein AVEN_15597-1, partial [Araneus ventricosus]